MAALLRRFHFALLVACLLAPGLSMACSPGPPPSIADYAKGRIPRGVVFLGTVRAVKKADGGNDAYGVYEIRFAPTRWLSGDQRDSVIVRGSLTDPKVPPPPCFLSDFLPKIGEQWLIVGQMTDGTVNPELRLSQRLANGYSPADIETELRKQGLTP